MIATPTAAPPAVIPTHRSTMSNAEGIDMDTPVPFILPDEPIEEGYLERVHTAAKTLAEAGFDGLVIVHMDPNAVAAHLREAITGALALLG